MINGGNFGHSYLDNLVIRYNFKSKRISSWDKTGKNRDFISLDAGENKILAEINGPGCIKHFYSGPVSLDPFFYRNTVLKIYWDGEENPSVKVPLGDFFGIGHCKPMQFNSLLISVNPGNPFQKEQTDKYGTNRYAATCNFPMPFSQSARIELENQSDIPIEGYWYNIDYHQYEKLDDNIYRFHASWNREITKAEGEAKNNKNKPLWLGVNLDGKENYVILETKGDGQMVGFILNVDNIAGDWWGEGDDMVFIDGDTWPPSIHGTGTEEIVGGGSCPGKEYNTACYGFNLLSNHNWYRQNSLYRFFLLDPIRFKKSIRYTIEHGHANNFENDYSSVAYWYQMEPHEKFTILLPKDRIPLLHSAGEKEVITKQLEVIKMIYSKMDRVFENLPLDKLTSLLVIIGLADNAYANGKYDLALNEWCQIEKIIVNLSMKKDGNQPIW
jgi:hypothetical protein